MATSTNMSPTSETWEEDPPSWMPILQGPENWDIWRSKLMMFMSDYVKDYLSYDHPPEPASTTSYPTPRDINPNATTVADLSRQEYEQLTHMLAIQFPAIKSNLRHNLEMLKAKAFIRKTISPEKYRLLDSESTLKDWIRTLEEDTAPSILQKLRRSRKEYHDILDNFDVDDLYDWAQDWFNIVEQCHVCNMPEMHSGAWLRDVARLMEPHSVYLFTIFMEAADHLDVEAMGWRTEAQDAMKRASSRQEEEEEEILVGTPDSTPILSRVDYINVRSTGTLDDSSDSGRSSRSSGSIKRYYSLDTIKEEGEDAGSVPESPLTDYDRKIWTFLDVCRKLQEPIVLSGLKRRASHMRNRSSMMGGGLAKKKRDRPKSVIIYDERAYAYS